MKSGGERRAGEKKSRGRKPKNSEMTYIFKNFYRFLVKITKTSLQTTKNLLQYNQKTVGGARHDLEMS